MFTRILQSKSQINKVFLAFITSFLLDKEEEKELHKMFHAYDTNNDGQLQKDEIKAAYAKYKGEILTEKEVD